MTIDRLHNAWGSRGTSRIQRDPGPPICPMARFRMQTRRDRVMSLLPPISLATDKGTPLDERIYSDKPPPVNYTGSFPSKILRHVDKNTFYSPPTRGESALISRTMYGEPVVSKVDTTTTAVPPPENYHRTDGNNNIQNADKTQVERPVKKVRGPKPQISSKSQVEFGTARLLGVKDNIRSCVSAPSSQGYSRETELAEVIDGEPGNLTAPTTPRPSNKDERNAASPLVKAESTEALSTHALTKTESIDVLDTRALVATPLDPKPVFSTKEESVQFELRGDGIESVMPTYDEFSRVPYTRPNSRAMTPLQRGTVFAPEVPISNQGHIIKGFYCSNKERAGIRSAIREVPRSLSRSSETRKEAPNLLIRAVGYSLNDNPTQRKASAEGRRKSAVRKPKELRKNGTLENVPKENSSGEKIKIKAELPLAIMGPNGPTENSQDGTGDEKENHTQNSSYNEKCTCLVSQENGHSTDDKNDGDTERADQDASKTESETLDEHKKEGNDVDNIDSINQLDGEKNTVKMDDKTATINEETKAEEKPDKTKSVRFSAKGRRHSKASRKKGKK